MTPFAGRGIDAYGHRAVLVAALALCATGALMTLAPSLAVVTAGLSLFASGVFFAQTASSSHVAHHAAHARGLALGLYATCTPGGSVGGALPALFWDAGDGPPASPSLVVEVTMLSIAWRF